MQFSATTALTKIQKMNSRLNIVQGGSSAGKTIAILLILINKAQTQKNILISVVSETMPHLKKGAMRDFLSIMQNHNYYQDDDWNKTDSIYTFETGSKIEFFSADQPGKVRGPRREILFINEVNNVPYETYTQLAIRTSGAIYLDYNPTNSFYVHENLIPNHKHEFLIITYKDNEALSPVIVQELESRKYNKMFWQVYGLGLLGEIENRIYTGWQIIDEVPHEAKMVRRGLDFGYTNDPSAIIDVYAYNGGYIFDEQIYQRGMSNRNIADTILLMPKILTVGDSSEPKSIDEIASYGIQIMGAVKGKDSVAYGIQLVQDQRISVTKTSLNLLKEYRSYLWMKDKNDKILRVPEGGNDHGMDALRYAMSSIHPKALNAPAKRPRNAIENLLDRPMSPVPTNTTFD